jgi:hypothetical protein
MMFQNINKSNLKKQIVPSLSYVNLFKFYNLDKSIKKKRKKTAKTKKQNEI